MIEKLATPRPAWLITPPHPEERTFTVHERAPGGRVVSTRVVETRRRVTRRIAGEVRTVYRLPVACVRVLCLLPELRLARVTDRTGSEFYARFDCLASDREKFRARFLALATINAAGVEPSQQPSGVPSNACERVESIAEADASNGRGDTGGNSREAPAASASPK